MIDVNSHRFSDATHSPLHSHNGKQIRTIRNAHYLWWSTLESPIWPQVWVQMGLLNNRIFTKITTTSLVKCMKSWHMIVFVIFTCRMSSPYSSWPNVVLILWFSLIFHFLNADFVPCTGEKIWFLVWSPEIVSTVDGSHWLPLGLCKETVEASAGIQLCRQDMSATSRTFLGHENETWPTSVLYTITTYVVVE